MNIETIIRSMEADVAIRQQILHYICANPEAFELLEWCSLQQYPSGYELWCTPPQNAAASFGRLLGHTDWQQIANAINPLYWNYEATPAGAPCPIVIVNAEKKPMTGNEVKL